VTCNNGLSVQRPDLTIRSGADILELFDLLVARRVVQLASRAIEFKIPLRWEGRSGRGTVRKKNKDYVRVSQDALDKLRREAASDPPTRGT